MFLAFLRLGLTSFGGPVAHIGYFRDDLVSRRRWVDERTFGDMVALSQFLPGPASSQVGIAIGAARAGLAGAFAAWLGFTLPSAIVMVLFAGGVARLAGNTATGWIDGLKVVAVAVVARAVWSMARGLCPDWPRRALAVAGAAVVISLPGTSGQFAAIAGGATIGWLFLASKPEAAPSALPLAIGRRTGAALLALFFALLILLPLAARVSPALPFDLADGFYRAGALVFGGGHVILPLLEAQVVPPGWIGRDAFLAGYGAAQALPGPLLAFSAYLGAMIEPRGGGWLVATLCLLAAFSCRRSCWCSGLCRSGMPCAAARPRSRPCAGSTRQWWGCCWRRSTIRCGPARSTTSETSPWQPRPWSRCGSCPPGW